MAMETARVWERSRRHQTLGYPSDIHQDNSRDRLVQYQWEEEEYHSLPDRHLDLNNSLDVPHLLLPRNSFRGTL
jgi:hypothetical protein